MAQPAFVLYRIPAKHFCVPLMKICMRNGRKQNTEQARNFFMGFSSRREGEPSPFYFFIVSVSFGVAKIQAIIFCFFYRLSLKRSLRRFGLYSDGQSELAIHPSCKLSNIYSNGHSPTNDCSALYLSLQFCLRGCWMGICFLWRFVTTLFM